MLVAHHPEPAPDRRLPFLRRIILQDYKSIENAAIELEAVTVLVGRNGSGKSNFLDALRFVAEGLQGRKVRLIDQSAIDMKASSALTPPALSQCS